MPDLPTPADRLAAAVHDTLSALVPHGGGVALAFSPIPTPLDPKDYQRPGTTEVEPVRAGLQLSLIADTVGELVDGDLVTGTVTASGLFGLLLSGTSNGTSQEAAVYGSLRGAAEKRYTGDLHLIDPSPRSWCVPDALGWTTFGWSSSASHATQEQSPEPPRRARWDWRVLAPEFRTFVERPVQAASVVDLTALEVQERPVFALSKELSFAGALATDRETAAPVSARFGRLKTLMTLDATTEQQADLVLTQLVPPPEARLFDPRAALQVSAELQAESTPHTADGTSMEVSFDYALVRLTRPWWDGLLVRSPGWTIAGYPPGSLSPGRDDPSRPPLGLPVGMLLVRDVTISGRWSSEQTSVVESSMSFGPFSLLGRRIATNAETATLTVSVDGMQLFAWLVEELPQLPPGPRPSAQPLAGPGTTPARSVLRAGSSGADVRTLQQRLHAHGHDTEVDGVFGAATTAAVRSFQTAAHLEADGVVGPLTWAALAAPTG